MGCGLDLDVSVSSRDVLPVLVLGLDPKDLDLGLGPFRLVETFYGGTRRT